MCVRLDKRCWLEVEDPRHRYAKNLRRYHHEWAVRRGRPDSSFWTWLDSNHEAISLPSCGREKLETEVVRYCSVDSDRRKYALRCLDSRLMTQLSCDSVSDDDAPTLLSKNALSPTRDCGRDLSRLRINGATSSAEIKMSSATAAWAAPSSGIAPSVQSGPRWRRLTTGPKGWIFVLHDGVLYARYKGTHAGSERFHHSSFFGGECVDAAGVIIAKDGIVTRLLPHSGHYRPREAHFARLLLFLKDRLELDLDRVEVDVQRLMRQARPEHSRKTDTPLFWSAGDALALLFWKAMAKSTNVLHDIELRRQLDEDDAQGIDYNDGATLAERASSMQSTTGLYGGHHHSQRSLSSVRRSGSTHSRASLKAECQRDQLHLEERMLAANLGVSATLQGRAAEAASAAAAAAAAAKRSSDKTLLEIKEKDSGSSHVSATQSAVDMDVSTAVVAADCGQIAHEFSVLSNWNEVDTFEETGDPDAEPSFNAPVPSNDDAPEAHAPKTPRPIQETTKVTTDSMATARRPRARSAESVTSVVPPAEHWLMTTTGQAGSILSSWNRSRRSCKANTRAKSKHLPSIPVLRHLSQLTTSGRSVSTPPPLRGDYWCPAESYSDGGRDGRSSDVEDSSSDDDTSSDRTGSEELCSSLAVSLADASTFFGEKSRRDETSQSLSRRFLPASFSSTVYSGSGSRVSCSDEENIEVIHPVVAEKHSWMDLAISANEGEDNPARSYSDESEEIGFTMDLPAPLANGTESRPAM